MGVPYVGGIEGASLSDTKVPLLTQPLIGYRVSAALLVTMSLKSA